MNHGLREIKKGIFAVKVYGQCLMTIRPYGYMTYVFLPFDLVIALIMSSIDITRSSNMFRWVAVLLYVVRLVCFRCCFWL